MIDPKAGRVLGIMISRAFGDALYKWPKETIVKCHKKYSFQHPRPSYATPLYLTAEHVVTTTQLHGNGEFLIMASDGLWDSITSEQAVKLVEVWLVARTNGTIGKGLRNPRVVRDKPLRLDWAKRKDEDFVVEDENVATHLVRNALGGNDHERLRAVIGVPLPLSRHFRDDVTVQVIFFEDNQKGQK